MTIISTPFSAGTGKPGDRYTEDLAALVHFSGYIAREARRLGLPDAAEKARSMECDLLTALEKA